MGYLCTNGGGQGSRTATRIRSPWLPLPVSGGFEGWTKALGEAAAFGFHRWIATNIFVPLLPVLKSAGLPDGAVVVDRLRSWLPGAALGVIGVLFVAHLWLGLYLNTAEWPWLYIFLIFVQGFFVLNNAGKSLGLDALLARAPIGPLVGQGFVARAYRRVA